MAERQPDSNARVIAIGNGATPEVFNRIICLTDNSFDLAINNITTETKCGVLNRPGTSTTTVTGTGVLVLDPDTATDISGPDLFTIASDKEEFNFKYGPILPLSGDVVYSGRGFFTAYNETDTVNTDSTFNFTIQVDKNNLTKTVTP